MKLEQLHDPDDEYEEYELVLQRRPGSNGRLRRHSASSDRSIANYVEAQMGGMFEIENGHGGKKEAAIEAATREFGLSRAAIHNALARHRKRFRRADKITPTIFDRLVELVIFPDGKTAVVPIEPTDRDGEGSLK
jgi:hypothetical protein